jgi:hypothetical protein
MTTSPKSEKSGQAKSSPMLPASGKTTVSLRIVIAPLLWRLPKKIAEHRRQKSKSRFVPPDRSVLSDSLSKDSALLRFFPALFPLVAKPIISEGS